MSTDTISLNDLDMDFSAPSTDLPDQGFYLFRIEKVRDAKVEANTFYKPDIASSVGVTNGGSYEDPKSGFWVHAKRTSVLIECRPLADAREDYAGLGPIYVYYDLTPKNGGGYRSGKQLRLLIDACFGATMAGVNAMQSLRDLEGGTFWGNLTHQKSKDGSKTYGKIANPTDQAPARYIQRTTGPAMDRIANSARYGDEPVSDDPSIDDYTENLNLPDDPQPVLNDLQRSLIGEVEAAQTADILDYIAGRFRRTNVLSQPVQDAIERKQRAFGFTN